MPRLFYPFLVYRSFFFPFFVLSLIVVPCWLVFRLYHVRGSGEPLSFRREFLLLILVFYFAGLASATLGPNHGPHASADTMVRIQLRPNLASLTCSSASLPRGSSARFFCLYNAKGNLLLFVPLGILLPLVWTRLRFWSAIVIALAVSISIEALQYISAAWGSFRLADINDVILNVSGAFLGLVLVFLLRSIFGSGSALARA